MRVIFSILSLLFTSLLVCADVVMYTRTGPPTGWQIQARAPQNAQLTFILALKQQNLDELDSAFWAISDPQSPRWRQHMSKEEINKMIAPDPQDVKAVYEWLYSHGVDKKAIDSAGDALEVKTTVQIIEKLFQTEMYVFSSFEATTNKTVIRQYGSYSVPDHIRPCIDLVAGLSTFPVPRLGKPRRVQAISPANSHSHSDFKMNDNSNGVDMGIIPQSVYAQYNISAQTTGSASTTTSQAVIEFEQQYFLNSDITTYAGLTGLTLNTVPSSQIIGANGSPGTMEGSLDIQLLAGVNTEASSWYWLEPQNTWFYGFALHFFNTTTIPQVIAISYGWYEGDECDSLVNPSECTTYGVDTWGYIARTNTEFQKIGARGVSVIVASGDSGTHSETDETCTVNNGYFRAEYPASSPYVTSVGATMFYNSVALSPQPSICTSTSTQCAGLSSETAVVFATATFSSGGGFSAQMPAPSYQRNAIQQYFASGVGLPPAAYYNASGRGIPDVAAVGHKILIHYSGINEAEDGTSASAPIFAAVISLLNQQSIAKNGSTLGFLNPLLYQMAAAQPNTFNDITTGDNNCTMYGCYAGCHGFSATTGWDPVTGLGSPNYGNMLTYLKNNL